MAVRELVLIAILHCTMGQWDPRSPLILVDLSYPHSHGKVFPYAVRQSTHCVVYHSPEHEDDSIIYPFCGDPYARYTPHPKCNYADEPFLSSLYRSAGHQRPKEICDYNADYDITWALLPGSSTRTRSKQNHLTCQFNNKNGFKYEFIYRLCQKNLGVTAMEKVIIYNVCYRNLDRQTMFGSYTIQTPYLLNSIFIEDERNHQFELDLRHYHKDFDQDIVDLLHYIYGQNGFYTPTPILPPKLLPFAHQRRPFFHYMNIAAMDTSLVPGWEQLMTNLRYRLSFFPHAINVTAGLLDTMDDDHGHSMHLLSDTTALRIAISKLWWVLIYNENNTQGVVIMMDNRPIPPNTEIYYDTERCNLPLICGTMANLLGAIPPGNETFKNNIYCCLPSVINEKLNVVGGEDILWFPNVQV